MLHWYRLIRAERAERSCSPAARSQIVADGPLDDPSGSTPAEPRERLLIASLTPEQRKKLFWLGFIEAAPLLAGAGFSIRADSAAQSVIAAIVGLALMALICWLLRGQVPLTRIELSHSAAQERHALSEATPRPNESLEPTAEPGE
jgi:hypothetical protein